MVRINKAKGTHHLSFLRLLKMGRPMCVVKSLLLVGRDDPPPREWALDSQYKVA